MGLTKLVVRGARQHNLKNISLEIPRNSLTVITGLSGSGKSSLAFDTDLCRGSAPLCGIALGVRRQFLDQMERPDVDVIEGLSPAIAIEPENHHALAALLLSAPSLKFTITCAWYSPPSACRIVRIAASLSSGKSSEAIVQAILAGRTFQGRRSG